jgi:hypothetical protein
MVEISHLVLRNFSVGSEFKHVGTSEEKAEAADAPTNGGAEEKGGLQ